MTTSMHIDFIRSLNPNYTATSKNQIADDLDNGTITIATVELIEAGCQVSYDGTVVTYAASGSVEAEIDLCDLFLKEEEKVDRISVGFGTVKFTEAVTLKVAEKVKAAILAKGCHYNAYDCTVLSDYELMVLGINEFGGYMPVCRVVAVA